MRMDTAITHSTVKSTKSFDGVARRTKFKSELLSLDVLCEDDLVFVGRELKTDFIESRRTMSCENHTYQRQQIEK